MNFAKIVQDTWHSITAKPTLAGQQPTNGRNTVCCRPCYKLLMKNFGRWVLFKCIGGQITMLSKPFKTKAMAEKAQSRLPVRERRQVVEGVVRIDR
jgi:hypothetical protein